jgi:RNA recognition motif-containing protein
MNCGDRTLPSELSANFGYSFEEKQQPEYNLFLSNVASTISKEILHEIFADYGKITKIILQRSFISTIERTDNDDMEEDDNPFGFAIIGFRHVSSVFDALIELSDDDDFSLMGEKIR